MTRPRPDVHTSAESSARNADNRARAWLKRLLDHGERYSSEQIQQQCQQQRPNTSERNQDPK
jgi:hypothetical protein